MARTKFTSKIAAQRPRKDLVAVQQPQPRRQLFQPIQQPPLSNESLLIIQSATKLEDLGFVELIERDNVPELQSRTMESALENADNKVKLLNRIVVNRTTKARKKKNLSEMEYSMSLAIQQSANDITGTSTFKDLIKEEVKEDVGDEMDNNELKDEIKRVYDSRIGRISKIKRKWKKSRASFDDFKNDPWFYKAMEFACQV